MNALTHNEFPSGRLIAIGDIHGCLKQLQSLIEELHLVNGDRVVFLGDYVDRGPDSKGVIDYLLKLRESVDCVFLIGNHEVMMLDYLTFGETTNWGHNGGNETLVSYRENGQVKIPESHIKFLNECYFYYDTPKYFFVHGGIKPHRTIAENLERMRSYDLVWEREHIEKDLRDRQDYSWEKTVVCGHTPQTHAIVTDKLICIDTGCVYNMSSKLGVLTAISLPSQELTQIKNVDERSSLSRFFSFMK